MKVRKTTFEAEERLREEQWLALTGIERLRLMAEVRERMRKPGVNYGLRNQKVRVIKKGK
jgi:hypothetical protein